MQHMHKEMKSGGKSLYGDLSLEFLKVPAMTFAIHIPSSWPGILLQLTNQECPTGVRFSDKRGILVTIESDLEESAG